MDIEKRRFILEKIKTLRKIIAETVLPELLTLEQAVLQSCLEDAPRKSREEELTLIVDGGSKGNPGEGYGSYAIVDYEGHVLENGTAGFGSNITNNESEYKALLLGLKGLLPSVRRCPSEVALTVETDSALIVGHLQGGWRVNALNLLPLIQEARKLLGQFSSWQIKKVPRDEIVAILGH